jgi:hypothetical protein
MPTTDSNNGEEKETTLRDNPADVEEDDEPDEW